MCSPASIGREKVSFEQCCYWLHVIFTQIANRDRLGVTVFQEGIVYLVATITQSDVSHTDAVIRALNPRVTQRSRQPCATGKITARYLIHRSLTRDNLNASWTRDWPLRHRG